MSAIDFVSSALFHPRRGVSGPIFGGVETKRGFEPLRWDSEIGIEARGKQGSGKTRGFVMPSLLTESVHPDAKSWPEAWRRWHPYGYEPLRILLDIKGSLSEAILGYRKSLGERVFVVDPYSDDPGVAKRNPFDDIRLHTKYMFSDCTRLAGWVVEPMVTSGEKYASYFDATAKEAMGGFIGHNAFRSIVENDPRINSPAGLITFLSGFEKIEDAIDAVLAYEHDPHDVAGWLEERNGRKTSRPTKTCPWIAQTLRVLAAKAVDEKSGIFGSTLKDLPIYRDPRIFANTTSSTFRIEDLINDRERSSIIVIRMPQADLEQLKPYVRLVINDWLWRLMPRAITIGGRETRGIVRPWELWLEESSATGNMEQVQKAASFMRGLGGKIITVWQNSSQVEATYGKLETISQNQGLHLWYTPEKQEDAEALSVALGEYTTVVKERNVSGDRMTLAPRGHLAESNRLETRRWLTPYEIKNLPNDQVIFFAQGLQGVIKQYWYDENPELLRRSQLPPPKESDVTTRVPFCITNMETELGPERFKLVMSPAPDKIAANREAADAHENGCRVFTWEDVDEDTGARTFFAQVWLPERKAPILNKRKGYESAALRDSAIQDLLDEFGGAGKGPAAGAVIVKDADDALQATDAIFDGKQFAIQDGATAPDPYEADRNAAEIQANGCLVHLRDLVQPETGEMLFCARVWLPQAAKPVLDKPFQTRAAREKKIATVLGNYDAATSSTASVAPAPDAYENDRDAAEVKPNGCRVYLWQMQREDTGETLFCARVWLPNGTKPVLDAPFPTPAARDKKIAATLKTYDDAQAAPVAVAAASALEAVEIAGTFDHVTGP
jgi:type IV secretory pathway TraG/TraD family ATPase VirD4